MNRSLDIQSQLRAVIYDEHGRPSIPTLDVELDVCDADPTMECSCPSHDHDRPARPAARPTHEILVERPWWWL